MNEVTRQAAQGDVLFRRVQKLPKEAKQAMPEGGRIIITHSETGHHHTADALGVSFFETNDPLVAYLRLESVDHADVVHHRPWDTHAPISLGGGCGAIWEVRRQREWTPEGWRQVQD